MSLPLILPVTDASIARAAALLRAGKLVAFPTETVYGLGADATQDQAVASIYAAKGRPQFNPLIVHVAETTALDNLIVWNDIARLLAKAFWPGPMTLVLQRQVNAPVSLLVSAGMDSLAVRIPSDPIARQLIQTTMRPIAAPSANASGKLSPTTAQHVAASLGNRVDLILEGLPSIIGLESTVIDLTSDVPTILRPGGITREQIEEQLGTVATATAHHNIVAPGMLASHYAPRLPVRLNVEVIQSNEVLLGFGDDTKIKGGRARLNLSVQGDVKEAAANLFSMLRQLDQPDFQGIAVMPIPESGLGAAINDRLHRASLRDK